MAQIIIAKRGEKRQWVVMDSDIVGHYGTNGYHEVVLQEEQIERVVTEEEMQLVKKGDWSQLPNEWYD